MDWKKNFDINKEIVLVTSSKTNIPNANIVISLGFTDDKLLVADCQMKNTINNIKENHNVCAIGGYFRVKGTAEIFSSGKYYDICAQQTKDYTVKNAVLISIDEVFDLDKGKIL